MSGRFITFEGIDGCGKSTQLTLLEEAMKRAGIPVLSTREPGGSLLGREIRRALLDPDYTDPPVPRAELLLFLADRAQHVATIIRPALEQGTCVLSDRYTDSTLVYQGFARGLDTAELRELNRIATNNLIPDRTLIFDLSPETGAARALKASGEFRKADRLESEDIGFRNKIRGGFLILAEKEPQRITVFDAEENPQDIHEKVLHSIAALSGMESLHV